MGRSTHPSPYLGSLKAGWLAETLTFPEHMGAACLGTTSLAGSGRGEGAGLRWQRPSRGFPWLSTLPGCTPCSPACWWVGPEPSRLH